MSVKVVSYYRFKFTLHLSDCGLFLTSGKCIKPTANAKPSFVLIIGCSIGQASVPHKTNEKNNRPISLNTLFLYLQKGDVCNRLSYKTIKKTDPRQK